MFKNKANNGDFVTFHNIAFSDEFIGWQNTKKSIIELIDFGKKNNINIYICFIDAGNKRLSESINSQKNYYILKKYIDSLNFNSFYNINEIFEQYKGNIEDLSVKKTDSHFSKKAQDKFITYNIYTKAMNYMVIYSNSENGMNVTKNFFLNLLRERFIKTEYFKIIENFIINFKTWNSIEIFPLFISEQNLKKYYLNSKRKVKIYEIVKLKISNKDLLNDANKEWFVISNGEKDYLFNFQDGDNIIKRLELEFEKKDDAILKDFFYETEYKEIENLMKKFIAKTEKTNRRDFLKTYEFHKKNLVKSLDNISKNDVTKKDLTVLKDSLVYISKIFILDNSNKIIDKSYSKYDKIKDKICITQKIPYSKDKELIFTFTTNNFFSSIEDLLFDIEKGDDVSNIIIKDIIETKDTKTLMENLTFDTLYSNEKKFIKKKEIEKDILKFKNFEDHYTEEEFNSMKNNKLAKHMLEAIFIIDFLEKSELQYNNFIFSRITDNEKYVYAGLGAICVGTIIIVATVCSAWSVLVAGATIGSTAGGSYLASIVSGMFLDIGGYILIKKGTYQPW
ncbi:MAG: hypothetical protein M0R46_09435 [Candidatus Muirbacterium halophilum]|nr:hypothetical protein [Candidatus Muirbacterium halophilum]MCK9476130.1 hypothetical protein [Candidatus Muirbacterium halophilum]